MAFYAGTTFLGAFLLFQVQLILARHILPWFGGSPSVWTACMMFFQVVLLAGYAYSHLLMTRLGPKRQASTHIVLLAASALIIGWQWLAWRTPLLPSTGWMPPSSAEPVMWILLVLALSAGIPYYVLSTTSSLMQAWFARACPGKSPYGLYALSNAGSLLGVLTYPFLFEPLLGLKGQAILWSLGFAIFAVMSGVCASRSGRPRKPGLPATDNDDNAETDRSIGIARIAAWVLLPAFGSLLFLATTSQVSEEVVVIPLMWVLPLAIYLLTFIMAFSARRLYSRRIFAGIWFLAMMAWQLTLMPKGLNLPAHVAVYFFVMFAGCMICHGELVRLRPATNKLTLFYVCIATGGASGGVFAAQLAPVLFDGVWELTIAYAAVCAALLTIVAQVLRTRAPRKGAPTVAAAALACLLLIAIRTVYDVNQFNSGSEYVHRDFFGMVRVTGTGGRLFLRHGGTVHGSQFIQQEMRGMPTTYYGPGSGMALALAALREAGQAAPLRVGAVGLGAGTVAAYGMPGDYFHFYEINPAIVSLSMGWGAMFSFINDSPARTEVTLGDARIMLDKETPQNFDLLVLDAFSGGTPPVHLLTREAFAVYNRHVASNGVIAVHVSNNYVDLKPVVRTAGTELGMKCALVTSAVDDRTGVSKSIWVLLSRDRALLDREVISRAATPPGETGVGILKRPWTDDYNNIFRLMYWD